MNISEMINNSRHTQDNSTFQDYIITACAPKILGRLQDPLSKPFIDSLNGVSAFEFTSAYTETGKTNKYLCNLISAPAARYPNRIPEPH
jgi:hypothetical protein